MGRGNEKTITCVKPGCGYTYTHKRMDSKGFRRERMLHVVTGECAKRVQVFNDREVASRLAGGGVTMTDVTEAVAKAQVPVYLMTSLSNDRETRNVFEQHNFFGFEREGGQTRGITAAAHVRQTEVLEVDTVRYRQIL